ncbi:MAG: NAD(P)-binding protein [Syntrophaceae bacterium]
MAQKEVHIYGAGMSGLVCAVNLVREGYRVVVHDREKSFGGDPMYNPSTHTTPIDVQKTSEYIGINVAPVFHPLKTCPFYYHDTKVMAPVTGIYNVERGDRPTSLDTLLYGIAVQEGVQFSFGSALKKEDLPILPPNTIIACGLTPSAYEMLGVPYLKWYGYISRGEIGFSNYSWIWWDEGITEYGYLSSANNYYFNLLFSKKPVSKATLEKYKAFMVHNEGVEHDHWQYVTGAVPIGRPDNPRLFQNNLIFCGTISGAMDPFLWFGILGALVTGKVAALAVYDRQQALLEFQRFTRKFRQAYYFKNKIWYHMRPHVDLMEKGVNLIGPGQLEKLGMALLNQNMRITTSVPGFANVGCY